jgi:protein-disulfide isomerase
MIDVLYTKQDSLGLKSWNSYAVEAGVSDTAAFARCTAEASSRGPIDDGLALGNELAVRATPTIIVNGWRFEHPPIADSLPKIIAKLSAVSKS